MRTYESTKCLFLLGSLQKRINDSFDKKIITIEEYHRVFDRLNIYKRRWSTNEEDNSQKIAELTTMVQEEIQQYGLWTLQDYLDDKVLPEFWDSFVFLGTENTKIDYPFYVKTYQVNDDLKVRGYFLRESLTFICMNDMTYLDKYSSWENHLEDVYDENPFVRLYFSCIDFGFLYTSSLDECIRDIDKCLESLTLLRRKSPSELLNEFLMDSQQNRYNTLKILLMGEDEDRFLAHILYDGLWSKPENKLQAEELFHYLPNHLQKLGQNMETKLEEKVVDWLSYTDEQISYEKQIAALRVSPPVKSKICEKLKEIRGSRENNVKAQQYLDGILRIPFGIYREEPIFQFFRNFRSRLHRLIQKMEYELGKWSPRIEKGDLWYYNRLQLILQYWGQDIETWSENTIETNLQNILNDLDELTSSPHGSPKENCKFLEIPEDIFQRVIYWENHWKELINEWQCFSVKKSEYIQDIRNTLSRCIYGHETTKKQIERLLAQWIHGKMNGMVFGFHGPPGVGKTTLAKKGFASCFKDEQNKTRPIGFLPLGGATNGSYLDGHHYTYLGSTWGRIVDILIESKCMNPIIYIDELDKVSQTEQGKEIISILTHVTDSSQNKEFYDRYFSGIPIDLSKVIFIFSYNDSNVLDKILRDRITEITINPLNVHEKIKIMQDYSLPEILHAVGYQNGDIVLSKEVLDNLIQEYTLEAGVRKLHEKLFEIIREVNLRRMLDPGSIIFPLEITWEWIQSFYEDLPKKFISKIHKEPCVGLVNGLYATSTGIGGLTIIQCVKTPSESKLSLELTGQQGDIMKESMLCAKTLAWNLLTNEQRKVVYQEWEACGIYGLHIHCPEAATPKDGPSAGAAITISMLSRLSGKLIRHDIALIGEIDLHGNIYPVGGVEPKLLGAYRAGVKKVFIPSGNRGDVHRISTRYKDEEDGLWLNEIEICYMEKVHEILDDILL